jgi:Sjoegren syndrome nuclear autoantigen 1
MLETIKESRDEVQLEIDAEEQEKKQIEDQMRMFSLRLNEINESLNKKYLTRNEFDKTIGETENAFMKILESSQTLLHVLKKEGASLSKKKAQTLTGAPGKKGEYDTPQRVDQ